MTAYPTSDLAHATYRLLSCHAHQDQQPTSSGVRQQNLILLPKDLKEKMAWGSFPFLINLITEQLAERLFPSSEPSYRNREQCPLPIPPFDTRGVVKRAKRQLGDSQFITPIKRPSHHLSPSRSGPNHLRQVSGPHYPPRHLPPCSTPTASSFTGYSYLPIFTFPHFF